MRPESEGLRPVVVLPLWRRGEERADAERSGVLRGHPGPVASDQGEASPADEV